MPPWPRQDSSQRWRDDELSEPSRLEVKQGHLPHFSSPFLQRFFFFLSFSAHFVTSIIVAAAAVASILLLRFIL